MVDEVLEIVTFDLLYYSSHIDKEKRPKKKINAYPRPPIDPSLGKEKGPERDRVSGLC